MNKFKNLIKSQNNKSSLLSSIFNVTNCIIGGGIIALSHASQKSGFGLSMILLVISGLLAAYTCLLLTAACQRTKTATYTDLVEKSLGKVPRILLLTCNILFPSFISIAYGVAMLDNLLPVFEYIAPNASILHNRLFVLAFVQFVVILPISIFKHVHFLEKISFLSIIFVLFYTCVFVAKTPSASKKVLVLPEHWRFASTGIFQSLGTLVFSFAIHHNIIPLYYALNKNTSKRFSTNLFCSNGISLIIYHICMISGLISFSGVLKSNLLKNYCVNDSLILATRMIFSLTLVATYPFQIMSAREAIFNILSSSVSIDRRLRYITTMALSVLYAIATYFSTSVGSVIEVGGSLTSSPLVLIFPPLVYMKVKFASFKPNSLEKVVLWAICGFGVVMMFLGTSLSIVDAIKEKSSNVPAYWCL